MLVSVLKTYGDNITHISSRGIYRSAPRMGSQRLALAGDGGNYPVRRYTWITCYNRNIWKKLMTKRRNV